MSPRVHSKLDAGVAWITLADPERGNALDAALVAGLDGALRQATGEPSCRVIVLRAEGDSFCRGLDLEAAFDEAAPDPSMWQAIADTLLRICAADQPVIASVEGEVSAGGVGLAAACDLVLASDDASFVLSEVIVGMIPALIAPFLLRRLTPARARYLALSSRRVRGAEARELGLIDELVEGSMARALERQIRRLLRSSPRALAASKRYFDQMAGNDLGRRAFEAQVRLRAWLDEPGVLAGIRTFNDGFAPPWFQKREVCQDV